MNVYDFDGTIYNGDSTVDFYWYVLKKKPQIIFSLPKQLTGFVLYAFKKIDKTKLKSYFFCFLEKINSEALVLDFWKIKQNNIYEWYHKQKTPEDVIISASPEFLLRPICQLLGIQCLIASVVDSKTGVFTGENCYGAEKVRRLYQECGTDAIDHFYSDSVSDSPLAKLAKRAFYVKKGKLIDWVNVEHR